MSTTTARHHLPQFIVAGCCLAFLWSANSAFPADGVGTLAEAALIPARDFAKSAASWHLRENTCRWLLKYNPELNGFNDFLTEAPLTTRIFLPDGSVSEIYRLKQFGDFNFRIRHSSSEPQFDANGVKKHQEYSEIVRKIIARPEWYEWLTQKYGEEKSNRFRVGARRFNRVIHVGLITWKTGAMGISNGTSIFLRKNPALVFFFHETLHVAPFNVAGGEGLTYPGSGWICGHQQLAKYDLVDPDSLMPVDAAVDMAWPVKTIDSDSGKQPVWMHTETSGNETCSIVESKWARFAYNLQGHYQGAQIEKFSNGKEKSRKFYTNGVAEGEYVERADTGDIALQRRYANGVLNGLSQTYYPGGKIVKEQTNYKDGKKDGAHSEFSEQALQQNLWVNSGSGRSPRV